MFKLYDYQQRIVDETRNKLRQGNKGVLIVSPPGSGKSVIIGEIARLTTLKNNHVLFTVHRQELIDQITSTFNKMGVNTDYTTIMTVGRVKNRLDKLKKPDLIIVDESQHSRAKTYIDILNYWNDVPRLGFSGSPWRMNGQGFDDIYETMVEGPDVAWLIDNHKLSPFTYYAPQTLEGFKKRNGEYDKKSVDDVLGSKIFGDAVSSYQKYTPDSRAILYAHSIEYSENYAKEFNASGVPATHVDGKTPQGERNRIIQAFRDGEIKVLCNVDLVSEGFDLPACEVVIMCRPTASLVLYLQQSMRCMRYLPDKQAIIIDHVGNYVRFGLPDDQHEWNLSGRNSKGKVDVPDIHTCQYCYQVFYEWTADNRCPYCGELKPEADPRTPEGKKQIEQAKMVEIANRKVEKGDSLISIYEHFKARKVMQIGNVHRPINAAIRQKGVCSDRELSEFAEYLNVKKSFILRLYNHKY